jgi:signal transduction histidine kinase
VSISTEASVEPRLAGMPPRFSVRTLLLSLIAAVVVPILAFSALLLSQHVASERERLAEEAATLARQVSLLLDGEVGKMVALLRGLASSSALRRGDLRQFHEEATRLVSGEDQLIVLRDFGNRQFVNTQIAFGSPMPPAPPIPPSDQTKLRSGEPLVPEIYTSPISGEPRVAVAISAAGDDGALYVLAVTVPTTRVQVALPTAPSGWIIGVGDPRSTRFVTRSQRHHEVSGKRADPSYFARATERSGSFIANNLEGVPVLAAYAYGDVSGWLIAVNVPQTVVEAPLRQSLYALLALGTAALALSLLFAWALGRLFTRAGTLLAEQAELLGSGMPLPPRSFRLTEFQHIQNSLGRASNTLQEQRRQQLGAEQRLRDFNARLEAEVSSRTRELTDANARLVAEMGQREALEGQLRQAQKMEAVGQLTGGIAHDFNNLLAVIMGSLNLLQRRLDRGEIGALQRFIDGAREGTERAANLVTRLLAFSRRQPLSPEPIDVNRLVAGMSDLFSRTLGEHIRIETVLANGLWRSHADPNQLEQSLLNLAVNARDAMPDGGKLTIETANAYVDEPYARQHPGLAVGQYVMIAMTDAGTGMTPEIAAKAFEPFFTTKKAGQGTGLGLSQVYGFVRQSGGWVNIYSEPGQGTTIKIYLPRFMGDAPPEKRPEPRTREANETAPYRGVKVLVVEDEAAVRSLTVEALTELGAIALEADGGLAALRVLDAHTDIALLFTDVVMPEMNGRRLAEEALRRRPELKVLFTTGYTRNAVVHNNTLDPGVHLLVKPFTLEQLAQKLREVLG